jgi:hypothetical protein
MTLHLTRSSRLWDTSTPRITPLRKKKENLTVSVEIHKGAIFDRLKIKFIFALPSGLLFYKQERYKTQI